MATRHICFATCAPGIEPLLHSELRGLQLAKIERQVGGCYFEALPEDIWRANLCLRTAVRVLLRLSRFEARTGEQLYENVQETHRRQENPRVRIQADLPEDSVLDLADLPRLTLCIAGHRPDAPELAARARRIGATVEIGD